MSIEDRLKDVAGILRVRDWPSASELGLELANAIGRVVAPVHVAVTRPARVAIEAAKVARTPPAPAAVPAAPPATPPQTRARPVAATPVSRASSPFPLASQVVRSNLDQIGFERPARGVPNVHELPILPPNPRALVSGIRAIARRPPSVDVPAASNRTVQLGPSTASASVARPGPSADSPTYASTADVPDLVHMESLGQPHVSPSPAPEPAEPVASSGPGFRRAEFVPKFTRIARERVTEVYFAIVRSRLANNYQGHQVYMCDMYLTPDQDPPEGQAEVVIWTLDPQDSLPVTYPLFPVHFNAFDGYYWAQPPLFY